MTGPTTTIGQDLERGEALRELSRAQRQLLAALGALESADPRDRAAAARALDHAEGRLAHAMSALERLAAGDRPPEEPGVAEAADSRAELPVAAAAGGGGPPSDVGGYLLEVADLARACAADVGELRSLLQTVERLGRTSEGAGRVATEDPEEEDQEEEEGDENEAEEEGSREAAREGGTRRRRQVLRRVASDLGAAALDDLERSLAVMEARMLAAARGAPAASAQPAAPVTARAREQPEQEEAVAPASPWVPVPGRAAAPSWQADLRLGVLEERLAAVERRLRWLEAIGRGPDGP